MHMHTLTRPARAHVQARARRGALHAPHGAQHRLAWPRAAVRLLPLHRQVKGHAHSLHAHCTRTARALHAHCTVACCTRTPLRVLHCVCSTATHRAPVPPHLGSATRRISPPFARLIAQQQAHEGELRHCHARLVAHAEEVALLDGGPRERDLLDAALGRTTSFSRRYYLLQFAQGAVDQARVRAQCACTCACDPYKEGRARVCVVAPTSEHRRNRNPHIRARVYVYLSTSLALYLSTSPSGRSSTAPRSSAGPCLRSPF